MQDLFQTAANIPWAGLVPVGTLFLIGLILWVAGRPVLRPVFTATGLIVGGLAGLQIGMTPTVESLSVPFWGWGIAGAVVAALLAAVAYRLLLVVAAGSLLGGLAPLLVWTAIELNLVHVEPLTAQDVLARAQDPAPATAEPQGPESAAPAEAESTQPDASTEPAPSDPAGIGAVPAPDAAVAESAPDGSAPAEPPAPDGVHWKRWIAETYGFLAQHVTAEWKQAAEPLRWMLGAAAAVGVVLGLIVGATAPSFSASVVTALGGALLLIGAGSTVAARLQLPPALLPHSAMAWLIWWIVAAVIGLGLQWIFRPKPADK